MTVTFSLIRVVLATPDRHGLQAVNTMPSTSVVAAPDPRRRDRTADSPGHAPKGLRHTIATILRTIVDMLQQKSESTALHYSRSAKKARKLTPVAEDLRGGTGQRACSDCQSWPKTPSMLARSGRRGISRPRHCAEASWPRKRLAEKGWTRAQPPSISRPRRHRPWVCSSVGRAADS